MDHEHFMTKALQQAEAALDAGEFPVGSVMVHTDRIISDIGKIVFAYEDAMGGGTQCDFTKLPPLYNEKQIAVVPNILRQKSLQLLKIFFSNPGNTYLKGTLLSEYTLRQ